MTGDPNIVNPMVVVARTVGVIRSIVWIKVNREADSVRRSDAYERSQCE